jgi:hypothetical protein
MREQQRIDAADRHLKLMQSYRGAASGIDQ